MLVLTSSQQAKFILNQLKSEIKQVVERLERAK